jgi:transcriptional regulator with XRE-family HTH domain
VRLCKKEKKMFWKNFIKLCAEKGVSPNAVARELSISSGAVTKWKNGATPQNAKLRLISDYFGVSTEYLLSDNEDKPSIPGSSQIKKPPQDIPTEDELFEEIKKLLDDQPMSRQLYDELSRFVERFKQMSDSEKPVFLEVLRCVLKIQQIGKSQ